MSHWCTLVPADRHGRTVHQVGLPVELGGQPVTMPPARFLVIEDGAEGSSVVRYADDGASAGDTWHPDHNQAVDQAAYEYGELSLLRVPVDEPDPVAWARSLPPSRFVLEPDSRRGDAPETAG